VDFAGIDSQFGRKKVPGIWNRINVGAFRASSLFTMAGVVSW
jgi:hypothetical protein